MRVLIDDQRTLDSQSIDITCRNADAGMAVLEKLAGQITVLYIDHDLGSFSISGFHIVEAAYRQGFLPKVVYIVSQNPVGVEAIRKYLIRVGYKDCGHRRFERNN